MTTTDQKTGAWCGFVFAALLGAGLLTAGFVPPPSPSLGADEVAAIYQSHTALIRIGMLLAVLSNVFYLPFIASISVQMRRMQGVGLTPVYLQLGAGSIGTVLLLLPELGFLLTAFRPERSPQLTMLLNDAAWLFFLTPFPTFVAQNCGIAWGILGDQRTQPVFPRWVAFLNLWTALLLIPAGLAFVFKTGPFAWNGLFSFWLPAGVFFAWLLVMASLLLKSVDEADAPVLHAKRA
jgi:hypothetical protein